jgi:hypothetical protein
MHAPTGLRIRLSGRKEAVVAQLVKEDASW